MKKNLLFAGLILAAAPICAQDEPTRTPQDAKVIFEQNFEDDWDAWQAAEIDRITSVEYYKPAYDPSKYSSSNDGNNLSGVYLWSDSTRDWTIFGTRDTLIILKNGVVTTDNSDEVKGFELDQYQIVNDGISGDNVTRQQKFDEFGVNGGSHYFRYTTDTVGIAQSDYGSYHTDGTTARYRRNLFVRGLDIEDETSYRLTVYVKTEKKGGITPTFYADVMRGYFASEKPFTKGYLESINYKNQYRPFEYTKNDFKDGEWEKITFMTYYLNDSIAQNDVFIDGYWWASEWKWRNPVGAESDTLCYIKQPDKFFVRLGFASDSTIFSVDNLSLTKSWIGGVEYYKDMIRVDFGYETCLDSLAEAAYNRNFIAAVVVPGEYFTVWGYSKQWNQWELVPIRTAEYHGDGYMYMWTQPDEYGGQEFARLFDEYDSVLVSFQNPVDRPELRLYYNGNLFPKSLDTEWMANGKLLPDFHNEIAYQNPNIGVGVYSMSNLPPVFQGGITAEVGSFQLDPTLREFTFKFSTNLQYDQKGEATELAIMHVEKAGVKEVWTVKSTTDSSVTFIRPSKYTEPLSGDYEFKLLQLKGKVTEYGEDRTINYSFGEAVMPSDPVEVNFNDADTETEYTKGANVESFSTFNCVTKVTDWAGPYSKALMFGLYGVNLYGGNGESTSARLFYEFTPTANGSCSIEIGYSGCYKDGSYNMGPVMEARIMDPDGNILTKVSNPEVKTDAPAEGAAPSTIHTCNISAPGLVAGKTYKLVMMLPNEGSWYGGHKGGLVLYYLKVQTGMSMSGPYLQALDAAQKALAAKIAEAKADKDNYTGDVYEAGVNTLDAYKNFNVTVKETAPSVWNAATKALNDATSNMTARFKVVDDMWAQYNASMALIAKYDSLTDAEAINYKDMDTYKALVADCEKFEDFICKDKTDDSIKAVQTIFENGQKALDAQKATVDAYQAALAADKAAIEAEDAQKGFDEYAELQKVYSEYVPFDFITSAESATQAATDALKAALAAYNSVVANTRMAAERAAVNVKWFNALSELAAELNADLGGVAVDSTTFDDAYAKVYKTAIKAAIYKKAAKGESVDSIPMSAFFKNSELWASTKVVERMDKQMPANKSDLKKADADGANIQHTRHQYNNSGNMPIWIMIIENDYTDLYPGWTARAFDAGNCMVTPAVAEKYDEFSAGQTFWNGELGMDWNSKATLTQTIEDLPVGMFSIGANFLKNSGSSTQFDIKADSKTSTAAVAANATGNNGIDGLTIENGSATVTLTLTSGNGWSRADDFYLVFTGKKDGFNYSQAATEAQDEVSKLVTFVDPAQADAKSVIYSLDGKKVQSAKAGQISIKVTEGANGKRYVEKVLNK